LLRLGILPTGTILPREHRVVRDLARKRMQLVQSCTTHVLAVENIMARQLGGRMTSNQIKRLTGDTIDSLPLAADVGLAIKANVAVIATLQSQIEVLEKRLQERVKPRAQYGLLTSCRASARRSPPSFFWKPVRSMDVLLGSPVEIRCVAAVCSKSPALEAISHEGGYRDGECR
jgi:hypothetical protein